MSKTQTKASTEEMIMSTISNITAPREAVAGGLLALAAIGRRSSAYIARRAQKAALARLRSLSDRDLEDIGLRGSQADVPVGGAIGLLGRERMMARPC
jgi:hypothetical protein